MKQPEACFQIAHQAITSSIIQKVQWQKQTKTKCQERISFRMEHGQNPKLIVSFLTNTGLSYLW